MYCNKCDRSQKFCQYPCLDFEGFTDDLVGVSYGVGNQSDILKEFNYDNECLSDYLTISVEDDEWLEILNKKYTIERVINYDLIYKYIEEKNREYCEQNGLCEECRSELAKVNDPRGEYFGMSVLEKILICPKCG